MPRPHCPRKIGWAPGATFFKPAGVPLRLLEEVVLTLDEVEAMRLADMYGMYQADAAKQMSVSRSTFSRIVEAARRKVAEAIVTGKALRVESGTVEDVGVVEGQSFCPGLWQKQKWPCKKRRKGQ